MGMGKESRQEKDSDNGPDGGNAMVDAIRPSVDSPEDGPDSEREEADRSETGCGEWREKTVRDGSSGGDDQSVESRMAFDLIRIRPSFFERRFGKRRTFTPCEDLVRTLQPVPFIPDDRQPRRTSY